MKNVIEKVDDLFRSDNPHIWNELIVSGLLRAILGDQLTDDVLNCPQVSKWHPEGSLSNHINAVFKNAVDAGEEDVDVMWSILMHDIGKPKCMEYVKDKKGERTTFYKHDIVGARKVMEILVELEMDVRRIKKIIFMVKNHMRISQIARMRKHKVDKLLNHEHIKSLMLLHSYDDMVNEVSSDCTWIEEYMRNR